MRKSHYKLDASHIPNNLEMVMAAVRCGLRHIDEVAEHASLNRSQADWALAQLRDEGHVECRRTGSEPEWFALDQEPFETLFVPSEESSVWGAFGYPTGVIAPLVGRVHRLPG